MSPLMALVPFAFFVSRRFQSARLYLYRLGGGRIFSRVKYLVPLLGWRIFHRAKAHRAALGFACFPPGVYVDQGQPDSRGR